jgi:hypothetical protein
MKSVEGEMWVEPRGTLQSEMETVWKGTSRVEMRWGGVGGCLYEDENIINE